MPIRSPTRASCVAPSATSEIPALAFVQTPQHFYNLLPGDPFGADAPLFYGPIMQGKDGWNAAFFCGSNAILRREALLQLGVTEYVQEMEERFARALKALRHNVSALSRHSQSRPAAQVLRSALETAHKRRPAGRRSARAGERHRPTGGCRRPGPSSHQDLLTMRHPQGLGRPGGVHADETRRHLLGNLGSSRKRGEPDAGSMGLEATAVRDLSLTRPSEAQPVLPLATISITEDMATAMRLHALGWKSAFHPEVLAYGLAPEDLQSALNQRLRWAEGTLQVLLRENPLFKRGLSFPQRIQYFTSMLSYFDGFASLVFVLRRRQSPDRSIPCSHAILQFLRVAGPYLIMNRLMYLYATHGINVRGASNTAWRSSRSGSKPSSAPWRGGPSGSS